MANDLNQCNFIGRLGRDVESRYLPSGDAVASFSLAVSSTWKDKQGAKQESTEWVDVTAFGKLGEICIQHLKKGTQVYVSGRMKTDKYEKDGVQHYRTKIIADRLQMLGSRSGGVSDMDDSQRQAQPQQQAGGPSSNFDDMDDDIQF